MSATLKTFLPVSDQIELLKNRGMAVNDGVMAERCLNRIGYYRLSAYWYPFRMIRQGPLAPKANKSSLRADLFISDTSFKDVFDFYVFDKKLRMHLSDGLERIEIAVRALIADLLGARDPHAHRNPLELDGDFARNLDSQTGQPKHQDWLRKQDGYFARSREDFAVHFRNKYSNALAPIWVTCEVWDWGMLATFFSGMKPVDKDTIAKKFGGVNGRQLETWLKAMNHVRNICAHHSRLWNRGLKVTPALPKRGFVPDLDHLPRGNDPSLSRLYVVLAIMRVMLKKIHPTQSDWHRRIATHALSAPSSPLISASSAGFPSEWGMQPLWQSTNS
jgi:abortive infection bacteriophage resistance protein